MDFDENGTLQSAKVLSAQTQVQQINDLPADQKPFVIVQHRHFPQDEEPKRKAYYQDLEKMGYHPRAIVGSDLGLFGNAGFDGCYLLDPTLRELHGECKEEGRPAAALVSSCMYPWDLAPIAVILSAAGMECTRLNEQPYLGKHGHPETLSNGFAAFVSEAYGKRISNPWISLGLGNYKAGGHGAAGTSRVAAGSPVYGQLGL